MTQMRRHLEWLRTSSLRGFAEMGAPLTMVVDVLSKALQLFDKHKRSIGVKTDVEDQ